jgi:predicted RNA-binding Zn-ribbon protein involved in translation (DUF1610 family)
MIEITNIVEFVGHCPNCGSNDIRHSNMVIALKRLCNSQQIFCITCKDINTIYYDDENVKENEMSN